MHFASGEYPQETGSRPWMRNLGGCRHAPEFFILGPSYISRGKVVGRRAVVQCLMVLIVLSGATSSLQPSSSNHTGSRSPSGRVLALPRTTKLASSSNPLWSSMTVPEPTGVNGSGLSAVTCVSSNDCWGVGSYYTVSSSIDQTLIEHFNGTGWSMVTAPNTSPSENNLLESVSCAGANFCVAVGSYYNGTDVQTLVDQWDGSSWSIVSSPNQANANQPNDSLGSASCVTGSFCIAVGEYWGGR